MLDLAIVGAGPCGLAAAAAARDAGLNYRVWEKGCVTQSLTRYPYYMVFFSTTEKISIANVPFTIPDAKPTRRQALAYYRDVVRHLDLQVRQWREVVSIKRARTGFALQIKRSRDGLGEAKSTPALARFVIVATGGFGEPNRIDVDGSPEALSRIEHYYREPYPYFDQDVLVVGGGNSAVETALDLHRNGVRVRMAHFGSAFDPGVKPWVRPDIDNRIRSGEIPMHWGRRVAEVCDGWARLAPALGVQPQAKGPIRVRCDRILAMTGWRPDHSLLSGVGVGINPKTGIPRHDPKTMLTNVPGVYVAGVVAAGYNANKIFIENGRGHGGRIVRHIADVRARE